ncbi:MAG: acyltransferase family protein [Pseudomonadota bacterium]
MSERLQWIDMAKGVGITLVVLGHAGRGISAADIPADPSFLIQMDRLVYAFHMPFFFVLSGVVFGMRPPISVKPALLKRVWSLLFPLAIWTYVFLVFRALAGSAANSPSSWAELFIWPIPPFAHFWFLWALLIITIALTVLRFLFIRFIPEGLLWSAAVLLLLPASVMVTFPEELKPFLQHSLIYCPLFALGALISASPLVKYVPSWFQMTLAVVGFFMVLWGVLSFDLNVPPTMSGLVLSVLLIIPFMALSGRFTGSLWANALAFLGLISLAIYVMHTIFSAGIRIALQWVGVDDVLAHVLLGSGPINRIPMALEM